MISKNLVTYMEGLLAVPPLAEPLQVQVLRAYYSG
jgi:hypothetical protein